MGANGVRLETYIEQANPAVRDSIRVLNDIEIDSCNDGGCNGYVVFGNHSVFRTRVAVKYYYYGENAHEEVSLIKHIANSNVLKVWDAHTIADGWAYFITDEHRNGNIDDIIGSTQIDTNTSIRIIRGITNGVGALHSAPNFLLHRDLKPANILIDDKFSPIIADFGSIKRMPQNASEVIASQHSALYRPPESYDNGKYYYASDIYQIGLLFYQLLGGYLPYEPDCYMTKAQKIQYATLESDYDKSRFVDNCLFDKARKERLLSYSTLPAYTDKRLIQIIKKATRADYRSRYANIANIQLALHSVGNLPNWYRKAEVLFCENRGSRYRIVAVQRNKYQIEREYSNQKWSKLRGSSVCDTENDAIGYLLNSL